MTLIPIFKSAEVLLLEMLEVFVEEVEGRVIQEVLVILQ